MNALYFTHFVLFLNILTVDVVVVVFGSGSDDHGVAFASFCLLIRSRTEFIIAPYIIWMSSKTYSTMEWRKCIRCHFCCHCMKLYLKFCWESAIILIFFTVVRWLQNCISVIASCLFHAEFSIFKYIRIHRLICYFFLSKWGQNNEPLFLSSSFSHISNAVEIVAIVELTSKHIYCSTLRLKNKFRFLHFNVVLNEFFTPIPPIKLNDCKCWS